MCKSSPSCRKILVFITFYHTDLANHGERSIASSITPVYFFSHGSTMMLGEESQSATYWKKAGDEALANNIKGVIMMVSKSSKLIPESH
jgi:hypothetical protein